MTETRSGANALERWRSEKTAAFLASAVAAAEPDPAKAALFKQMAAAAEEQAGILARDLGRTPDFTPSLRARLIADCDAGPRAMRPACSISRITQDTPRSHPRPRRTRARGLPIF